MVGSPPLQEPKKKVEPEYAFNALLNLKTVSVLRIGSPRSVVTNPDCGTWELTSVKPALRGVVNVPCLTLPTKVLVIVLTDGLRKKKPSPGTKLRLGLLHAPKKKVDELNVPFAVLNLNTAQLLGREVGKSAATVFVAPSSGLLAIEKPGGKLTFTNPTALTEKTVWAVDWAAAAAIRRPAAKIAFAFIF